MIRTLIVSLFLIVSLQAWSQGMWYGPRGGIDLNFQQWNGAQRNSLVTPHIGFFVESYDPYSPSSFYANLGFHTRGSSVNYTFLNGFANSAYRFNNIVLGAGGKRKLNMVGNYQPYYILGLRAEYTVSTNLSDYENTVNALIHPVDAFVRRFNYGATVGGGFELNIGGSSVGFIEFAIHPDLSRQYDQPPLNNIVVTRFNNTQDRVNLPQREIRNLSFEVTVGIKLLRIVEYID